jgi:hypothetical protein
VCIHTDFVIAFIMASAFLGPNPERYGKSFCR